jgi:transmembrane sensor
MQDQKAAELLKKWKEGSLTSEERSILESWYLSLAKEQDQQLDATVLERFYEATANESFGENPQAKKKGFVRKLATYSAAASVLLMMVFYFSKPQWKTNEEKPVITLTDIAPGDNRAMLTLADGSKITLDHAAEGEIVKEGKTSVVKTGNGQIIYRDLPKNIKEQKTILTNTLTTPKAGHYQVTLSDGTKVWLNAASSIRFPTTFNSNERLIEVVGEVYLEVKKWKHNGRNIPFKVKAGSQMVEVLGTRFNINSYVDEGKIKTTLLEGSIQVHIDGSKDKGVLLKPGEQAQLVYTGASQTQSSKQSFKVSDVDLTSVVAWKEGFFHFNNIGLPELMRQISRWYDMEVVYEGVSKEYEFVGEIERGAKLSKVLTILESGGVNFRVEGRKIIVMK